MASASDAAHEAAAKPASSTETPPRLRPRWLYSSEKSWIDFEDKDQQALEARFQALGGVQWHAKVHSRTVDGDEEGEEDKEEDARSCSSRVDDDSNNDEHGLGSVITGLVSSNASDQGGRAAAADLSKQARSISPIRKISRNIDKATESSKKDEPEMVRAVLDPDEPEEKSRTKVPVLEDKLFDVDLEQMAVSQQ